MSGSLGHAGVLANVQHDVNKRWNEMYKRPLPKLFGGFMKANEVFDSEERAKLGLAKEVQGGNLSEHDTGIPIIGVTLRYQDSVNDDVFYRLDGSPWKGPAAFESEIEEDIKKLGIGASQFRSQAILKTPREQEKYNLPKFVMSRGLYILKDKPNPEFDALKNKEALKKRELPVATPMVPNREDTTLFLAYLMHKGFVSKEDAPTHDAVYPIQSLHTPFDKAAWNEASSLEYQNKVRDKLGEPLLDKVLEQPAEPNHTPGILHMDRITTSRSNRYNDLKI